MGEIQGTSEAFHWSVSKLATCFGVDRRTVAKQITACDVEPAGMSRGNPVYAVGDVARAVFSPKAGTFTGPQDLDQFPEARKAWFQSENERLKFEKEIGQLIPETEHSRTLAAVIKAIAAGLDSLPDILERDAGLDPDQITVVIDLVDSMRSATAAAARKAVVSDG